MHDNNRRSMPSGSRKNNCSHLVNSYDEYDLGCISWMMLEYRFELVTRRNESRYRTSKLSERSVSTYQAARSSEIHMPNTSVSTAELLPYIAKENI